MPLAMDVPTGPPQRERRLPRHGAARHATADSCLWLGDIPTAWGSQSRLKRVLYQAIPREVPQPWLKKVVLKRYRDRNSGLQLGYAIVCFRDSAEAADMLQVLDGLHVLPASVFRPEELSAGGRAADLVDDAGFKLRAKRAEHGDIAPARPIGLEVSNAAGLDPPLVEQLRPLSDVELRRRIGMLARMEVNAPDEIDAESVPNMIKEAPEAAYVGARKELEAAVLAYERCPRQIQHAQGSLLPETLAEELLAELEVLRWPAKNHRPVLTSDRYLVLLSSVTKDCYGKLRRLCTKLMSWAAPGSQYSAIAVTKNFIASPHIDDRDRCPQYAVSLGDFSGGELCVDGTDEDGNHIMFVVETKNRIARIDGRRVHWVRTFSGGDRYSLIFYDTSDHRPPERVGPAFDASWSPGGDSQIAMQACTATADQLSGELCSGARHARKDASAGKAGNQTCTGCGQVFASRNALFRHLGQSGCSGNSRQRILRYLVLYGYVGTGYHGSQKNAPEAEAQYPTVEGSLLAAIQSAMLKEFGATSASVEVRSRSSRTDRGVHALGNAICLNVETNFEANADSAASADTPLSSTSVANALRQHLPPELGLVACFELQDMQFDARFACQKREYWYYVPYRALWLPEEVLSRSGSGPPAHDAREQEDQWVWVMGLKDDCSEEDFRIFAESRLAEASAAQGIAPPAIECVDPFRKRGSGYLKFSDASAANLACALLDGAEGTSGDQGEGRRVLLALPGPEARVRRAVHGRLRTVLSRLTGTRSFHNFSPGFADATSDPRSVRSVYRCRSELISGFRDLSLGRDFAVLRITGRDFLYRQILSMSGLAVAIARGSVPEAYLDLAFNSTDIEVPCAPAGNLVLAECVFRDGAFKPDSADATAANGALLEAIVTEVSSSSNMNAFENFLQELDVDIGPRLSAALGGTVKAVDI